MTFIYIKLGHWTDKHGTNVSNLCFEGTLHETCQGTSHLDYFSFRFLPDFTDKHHV